MLHDSEEKDQLSADQSANDKDWWRGAVIYQIYPRSFQDNNGDGIGDLVGITQRLDYVASLGVDAIWLSPFFTSPMKDFGYDVADYRDVDPMFGTLEDFDRLVQKAHALGLKVIIDQVISHSSDQHHWFQESRVSRTNQRHDWYVWSDPNPDGTPPNNWLSIFGGSAWTWDARRKQYYLHNFLASQPDLNFHNRDVQDALLSAMRFWLERGVDGFRLDTVNFYFHSEGLEANPPVRPEDYNASTAPDVNPYNLQDHLYDKSRPENLDFLMRFRQLMDAYPNTTSVGEVGDAQRQLELMSTYTAGDARLHMAYTFEFLGGEFSAKHFKQAISDSEAGTVDGWQCLAFSNHDVVRHASRWARHGDADAAIRLAATMLLTMRGSVCLYQGEELGLPEADIAFDDLQDPYGKEFWPNFKGRDGCRTPIAWESAAPNGAFTTADKPWLPIPSDHKARAVDSQEVDDASTLAHYRDTLAFRKVHPELISGSLELVQSDEDVLVFTRQLGDQKTLCVFNLSPQAAAFTLPTGITATSLDAPGSVSAPNGDTINLPAYGAFVGSVA